MKEYIVQCLAEGKWTHAKHPILKHPSRTIFKTIEAAQKRLDEYRKAWSDDVDYYLKNDLEFFNVWLRDRVPVQWRILSREVTDWQVKETQEAQREEHDQ